MWIRFSCFKQKTAYEMRISDWSSDVCSSDLSAGKFDRQMRRPRHEQLGADRSACPFEIARTTHSRSDQKDPHRLVALLNERFKKSGGFSVEPAGPGPVHYRFRCRTRQMVQLILPDDEGKEIGRAHV